MQPLDPTTYLRTISERGKKARVTTQFQLIGLEIALALKDLTHKALYIKYAKELGAQEMLALAKDIASRRDVKNPGAYFMRVVQDRTTYKKKSRSL